MLYCICQYLPVCCKSIIGKIIISKKKKKKKKKKTNVNLQWRKVSIETFVYINFNFHSLVWHLCFKISRKKIESVQKREVRFLYANYTKSNLKSLSKPTIEINLLKIFAAEVFETTPLCKTEK